VFARDPEAAVLEVLRFAGKPLKAGDVKAALVAVGVPKADADKAWPRVQKRIKEHANVAAEGAAYRWTDEPRAAAASELTAEAALDLLLKGRLAAARKTALAAIVRSAVASSGAAAQGTPGASEAEALRRRQSEIDAVRQLAELASEVEELIANETEPAVLVRQIRAWVQRSGLDPIGRAGEETRFDRKLHRPVGGAIRDGATVFVVRPGYFWRAAAEDVLIAKAVVEE
jgi:hypothetical protein